MKFSIITATYNNEHNIKETIESVLKQTYSDFEIIIVDNCSDDKTLDIIKEFDHDRIKVFSEHDTGIYNAFNKGIKKATGEIISFLNAGDYYLPDTLNCVSDSFIRDGKLDCVHGNIRIDTKEVKTFKGIDSLCGCRIFHPATFMKREIFKKLAGFNEKYRIVSDLDLFIRGKKAGYRFKYVDKAFTIFELGGKSTENRLNTLKETARVLKNNEFPLFSGKLFLIKEYCKYLVEKGLNLSRKSTN